MTLTSECAAASATACCASPFASLVYIVTFHFHFLLRRPLDTCQINSNIVVVPIPQPHQHRYPPRLFTPRHWFCNPRALVGPLLPCLAPTRFFPPFKTDRHPHLLCLLHFDITSPQLRPPASSPWPDRLLPDSTTMCKLLSPLPPCSWSSIILPCFPLLRFCPIPTIHLSFPKAHPLILLIMNRCYNSYGQPYRCRTAWNSWGRWAALGVIVAGALLLFFLCA